MEKYIKIASKDTYSQALVPVVKAPSKTPQLKNPKKRARRCPRLDDDEIKEEMRFLYQVMSLKPNEIAERINESHNLTVTSYQVRDKLSKLGYKKRLGPQQSEVIYRHLVKRRGTGKESEVIIGGIRTISREKLLRSMARNLKATQHYHISKGVGNELGPTELPENIQMCTPKAFNEMFLPLALAPVPRHIPLSVLYSLPIWEFGRVLAKIDIRYPDIYNGNLKITAHQSIPHSPLLRLIIYSISNDIRQTRVPHKMVLLNKVTEFNLQEPLKVLLSNNSVSIRAVCERLLPWLYIIGEYEIVEFIRGIHGIKLDRYQALHGFVGYIALGTGYFESTSRSFDHILVEVKAEKDLARLEMAIEDIEETNTIPESFDHLKALFIASWLVRRDLSLFVRMWDQKKNPAFRQWRHALKYVCDGIRTPLPAGDQNQIKLLLSLGFHRDRWTMTLWAILRDNYDLAKIFLEHFNLISIEEEKNDIASLNPGSQEGPKFAWERLKIPLFYQLVVMAVVFDGVYQIQSHRPGCLLDQQQRAWKSFFEHGTSATTTLEAKLNLGLMLAEFEDYRYCILRLLVEMVFLNLEMADYVAQVIKWANFSITQAADLLPFWDEGLIPPQRPCGCPNAYKLYEAEHPFPGDPWRRCSTRVPQEFARLGADLTRTGFWRAHFWYFLDQDLNCAYYLQRYGKILWHFKNFLRCPGMVNSALELPTRRLSDEYCKVFGFGNHGPLKPIALALFLRTPYFFLWLLEFGAHIPEYLLSTENSHQAQSQFNKEFMEACRNRDYRAISTLWRCRIEPVDTGETDPFKFESRQIGIHLAKWQFDHAARIAIQSQNRLFRISLFLSICGAMKERKGKCSTEMKSLRSILDAGISLGSGNTVLHDPGFAAYNHSYKNCLRNAICCNNIELVEMLLEYETQLDLRNQGSSLKPYPGCPLCPGKDGYIYYAAEYSLESLKRLIEHGFDINGYICGCPASESPQVRGEALSGALCSGNMANLVFVLQNGADIYAPSFLTPTSAIEAAAWRGHLDAMALMLSVDPNSYHLVLRSRAAAKDNPWAHGYIVDYIRNWKPRSEAVLLNQKTTVEGISDFTPIALSGGFS
ncbi:hypothetical protein TWF481_009205 [Arthrobotrys musiformis]|uniref:Clr5 domain-containing protein n=1 Tax=Arthrobotrys musiformis TaxID=47236 RepID=A0AAV9W2Y9_9PEZI